MPFLSTLRLYALWDNTSPLLKISVLGHSFNPSNKLGWLEHNKTCFFKKVDAMLQVTVERMSSIVERACM
ncbi:hypothetical protein EJ04DRAFT_161304 [Polyplosphaeria fusca]|uniref:Uncharacterized protein n=1 Tax=Polyplosphaeria fusca TaxID=682080 RepID=A0A9P4RBQ2_9PLEO|nr:hypothetical protein EJ04DRAFT_161304 [Polyplosphaeria fusca]